MNGKKIMNVVVVILSIVILSLINYAPASGAEPVVLKAGGAWPSTSAVAKVYMKFIDMVNENGKGRLKIQWVGGPEFVKEQDLPMAVATGVLDVMMTAPGYLSSSVPAAGIVGDYPLYRSYQTAEKAFYEVNKIISPVYKEKLKIMPIAEVFLAPFYLWTKKPVKTMEDIKGLKIRAHGGLVPFIISNLGGSPTTTATTDVYMALERGLIDGAIRNLAAYNSFKEYEFAKYGLNINITWAAAHVFISTKTWNKLPKDLQLILWDTGRQATIYNAKFWEKVNNKFKSQFGDQKVVFSEVLETAKDPMMEAIKNGANQGAQKLSSQYAESIIKAFKKSAE